MPRRIAEQTGIEGQARMQMRFAPVHAARERTLGPGRIRLAGIQALNIFHLGNARIVLGKRQAGQQKQNKAGTEQV